MLKTCFENEANVIASMLIVLFLQCVECKQHANLPCAYM